MAIFFFISCLFYTTLWCDSWVIVANGSPFPVNELKESLKGRKVLALDGAVDRFKSLQLYPDYILGDFDSVEDPAYWGISALFSEIDEHHTPYRGNFGTIIIPALDQNYSDLEKGIIYCDKAKATSLLIVQATGRKNGSYVGEYWIIKEILSTAPRSHPCDGERTNLLSLQC